MDPAILVLDEPTTGQDARGVARVGAIVEPAAAGRTVIAITHDMEFAARHFDRVVVMRRGVVADGPPEEVFARRRTGCSLDRPGCPAGRAGRCAPRASAGSTPTGRRWWSPQRSRLTQTPPGPV